MIHTDTLCVGALEANCHIVSDSAGNAVFIDPGAEPERILSLSQQSALHPLAILLTHGHFDHFGAAAEIIRQTGIPLYLHKLDEWMLHSAKDCLASGLGLGDKFQEPTNIHTFSGEDDLSFSEELRFHVLHTPGHTAGSCCFLIGNQMYSGDTLFCGSVGRTDFPSGNSRHLQESLRRIGQMDGDFTIYCGHYENTTLSAERKCNPYVNPELRSW